MRRLAVSSLWVLCLTWFGGHALADTATKPYARSAATANERQTSGDLVELAARYENGEGVTRDYARALVLYCQAADLGDATAFLSLGWMYMNGRGVAADDSLAVRWFKKAAESGISQAVNLLHMLADVKPASETGCPSMSLRSARRHNAPPEISRIVAQESARARVDANLVMAIIAAESDFNPQAVSMRNAQGLMQLMPETAARFRVTDTFDPRQNIRGGAAYLRWLLDRFAGDLKLALAAYNAGENAVSMGGGVPNFPETVRYVAEVTEIYLSSSSSAAEGLLGKRPVISATSSR
jgi:soluble lytic murein transglycosylase-like protein